MFLRGMAVWLIGMFAFFVILVWVVEFWEPRNLTRAFSWPVILSPALILLSWLGFKNVAYWGVQEGRNPKVCGGAAGVGTEGAPLKKFHTQREAKEYLIDRIASEAEREGIPLTEIERRLLNFSETGWTLSGMKEVNAEFERDYDEDAYERKIAGLASRIEARDAAKEGPEQADWDLAIEKLSRGDHYLLVLINAPEPSDKIRPLWLKVLVVGLGLILLGFLNGWSKQWFRTH
jgi:hypothetical protein